MANNYVVPFEWNPTSTTIKTTTYTVPAGYRARVRPTNLETDFTIDAVVAVEKTKYTGTSTTSGTFFTNTSCYPLQGSVSSGNNGVAMQVLSSASESMANPYTAFTPQAAATGSNYRGASTGPLGVVVMTDALISHASATSRSYHLDAIGTITPDWFWVPTDTDLNGTRYVVELYPNIA